MGGTELQVLLQAELGPDVDETAAAMLVQNLRREILRLDVDGADFVPLAASPAGAKGAGLDWSRLLLTLSSTGGVLTTLIASVQSWASHDEQRTVTMEIRGDKLTVTGISSADQKRLVDAWIRRHGKK